MPISGDRKLKVGTKLVARYKGHDYECEVGQAEDGKITYNIDGEHFKSPSRAGTHVMGGIACNGWRFWSVKGSEEAKPKAPKTTAAKKAARKPKAERKPRAKKAPAANPGPAAFERIADGRYFCNGCMAPFATEDDLEPKTCPQGHGPEEEEALADAAATKETAETSV